MIGLAQRMPVVFTLAAFTYITFLITLFVRSFREWFLSHFNNYLLDKKNYIPILDSYRGIAALWVATFHAWQWNGSAYDRVFAAAPIVGLGTYSVPFFCVLSGFLLHKSVSNKKVSMKFLTKYFSKRLLRVYPVYFVSVVLMLFLGYYHRYGEFEYSNFLREIFMVRIFSHDVPFTNPPSWSIYVEELFYVLLPMWLLIDRKKSELIAAILLLLTLVIYSIDKSREVILFKFFIAGMIVSIVSRQISKTKWRQYLGALSFSFGAFLLYLEIMRPRSIDLSILSLLGVHFPEDLDIIDWSFGIFNLLLAFSFIIFGSVEFKFIRRVFEIAPLRVIGSVSYSIYIWHSFVIVADTPMRFNEGILTNYQSSTFEITAVQFFALYLPAFIAVGLISYFLIERPFLIWKEKISFAKRD